GADRRDRAQLAVDLATAKQALAQADSRQHDREAQLQQSLKALDSERRNITTPAQIIRELPRQISLPAPITLEPIPPQESSDRITPSRVVPASGVARDPQDQSQPRAQRQLQAEPRASERSGPGVNWFAPIARKANQP